MKAGSRQGPNLVGRGLGLESQITSWQEGCTHFAEGGRPRPRDHPTLYSRPRDQSPYPLHTP